MTEEKRNKEKENASCQIHAKHTHQHGENCGHKAIPHGDHVDYEHDGHLHRMHGDHVDECKGAAAR